MFLLKKVKKQHKKISRKIIKYKEKIEDFFSDRFKNVFYKKDDMNVLNFIKRIIPPKQSNFMTFQQRIFDDVTLLPQKLDQGIMKIWARRDNNRLYLFVILPIFAIFLFWFFLPNLFIMTLQLIDFVVVPGCFIALGFSLKTKFSKKAPSFSDVLAIFQSLVFVWGFNLFNLFYFILLGFDQHNAKLLFAILIILNRVLPFIDGLINDNYNESLLNVFDVGLFSGRFHFFNLDNMTINVDLFLNVNREILLQKYIVYVVCAVISFHYPIYKFLKKNHQKRKSEKQAKVTLSISIFMVLFIAQINALFGSAIQLD